MIEIRISRENVEWGPYSLDQVNQMLENRQFAPSDFGWTEGMTNWEPLSHIPGVRVPAIPAAQSPPAIPASPHVVTRVVRAAPGSGAYPEIARKPTTAPVAVVSLVLGFLGILSSWMVLLGIPTALAAVICGHVARSKISRSRRQLTGSGMALTGLILGYVALLLPIGLLIFALTHFKEIAAKVRASHPQSVEEVANQRKTFTTKLQRKESELFDAPESPDPTMKLVNYPTPAGPMAAYVSVNSTGAKRLPAIVWLSGGFGNTVAPDVWEPGPAENDQSASTFHDPNLVILYPSMRGGNRNPGFKEGLFGEVDDVGAAIKWLATQPGVDPTRIYLAGHSTGGTLALLVAECTPGLRAVFSFGPVANVSDYGSEELPYNTLDSKENDMRSPRRALGAIPCPTFIMEGTDGNVESLRELEQGNSNPLISFHELKNHDHFSGLQPVSRMLLGMILKDTGKEAQLRFDDSAITRSPK